MYVNMCICIAPGADMSHNRIRRDIRTALNVWSPVSFHITKAVHLGSSYTFRDREISYMTPFAQQPKVQRLLQKCLSLPAEADIYVCYVGGNYFQEKNVIACAYSHLTGGMMKGFIMMTNAAKSAENTYTLAHEIGHILLTRKQYGQFTNADPHSPEELVHHPNPQNLMHAIVPSPKMVRRAPDLLTDTQRTIALNSPLLRYKEGNP